MYADAAAQYVSSAKQFKTQIVSSFLVNAIDCQVFQTTLEAISST